MRKILFLLFLLFLIFTPKLSFSKLSYIDTKIIQISSELGTNGLKLLNISRDLISIGPIINSMNSQLEYMAMTNINNAIENLAGIFSHQSEILAMGLLIKDEYKISVYKEMNRSLKNMKEQIKIILQIIRDNYAYIKNNAALHLIDKAKEITKSSSELLDKSIETLKSINERSK